MNDKWTMEIQKKNFMISDKLSMKWALMSNILIMNNKLSTTMVPEVKWCCSGYPHDGVTCNLGSDGGPPCFLLICIMYNHERFFTKKSDNWYGNFILSHFLAIRSSQIFAHGPTVQLLGHVQRFVFMSLSQFEYVQNSIFFNNEWKIVNENGLWCQTFLAMNNKLSTTMVPEVKWCSSGYPPMVSPITSPVMEGLHISCRLM